MSTAQYSSLRTSIRKIENINVALNSDVDKCLSKVEELESVEEIKSLLFDLMLTVREQMSIQNSFTNELHRFNEVFSLDFGTPTMLDDELKKQIIKNSTH